MPPKLAVIGGSAAWTLLARQALPVVETVSVPTPYGVVPAVHRFRLDEALEAWFISRHGQERYAVAAPFVNYRAMVYALKTLGVERVLSWSGPGSLRAEQFQPGDLVLPDDIVDETRRRPSTFFEGKGWGFIRMRPVFCPHCQEALRDGLRQQELSWKDGGVYVCTEGPRLETPAEVRKYIHLGGDLVGMTLSPEAFLARELELCYAPLCYVTNFAEGVVERPVRPGELFGGMLTQAERDQVDRCVARFPGIILAALHRLEGLPRDCPCAHAMSRYRREGTISEDWRTWCSMQ